MSWKAIGKSVTGTSHLASGKGCEDVIQYSVLQDINDEEVLICCASDGAGSARFASLASEFATNKVMESLSLFGLACYDPNEKDIFTLVEDVYEGLALIARLQEVALNEYSCTLLGCYLSKQTSVFFQIGDGAIVTGAGNGQYSTIWWPQNGEYHNTTTFIVDDPKLPNLRISITNEETKEIALFSDGLQMLALNMENKTVHHPFFNDLFTFLRKADDYDKIEVLNNKLEAYLDSDTINNRTDDDKTLFLATRI